MPNGFGGSIWEELAFCKLPNNETECNCMVTLPAKPQPRVTHQQRYSHSVTRNIHTHARAAKGVNHRGKDHFTVLSAGSSIQKRSCWGTSALPEAAQSCSCPARHAPRGHKGWEVLERE